jgi:hypothetical protein
MLRRSTLRKLLQAVFLLVIVGWHVLVFQIYSTTTSSDPTIAIPTNPVNNNGNKNDSFPPMLIVGGSDGSGTRAFVEILRELGTVIVSEDPSTFDVHASEIKKGWPGLIERIFKPFDRNGFFSTEGKQSPKLDSNAIILSANYTSTSSSQNHLVANYEWPPQKMEFYYTKIYERDTKNVETDVEKLLTFWTQRYNHQMQQDPEAASPNSSRNLQAVPPRSRFVRTSGIRLDTMVSKKNQRPPKIFPNAVANDVTYAIKAPISMLALPVFTASYLSFRKKQQQPPRPLKFLHVIRDGRDVALSDNQSPVIKFYDLTYPKQLQGHESLKSKFLDSSSQSNKLDRMYAKAIQLWNDWNLVVHRWATKHDINNPAVRNQSGEDVPVVDYLWVRSEDLLVPGSQKRLDALIAMAKFVGSSLTPEELCCLSRQDTKDHGQSHSISAGAAKKAPRNAKLRQLPPSTTGKGMMSILEDYGTWKSFVDAALGLQTKSERNSQILHLIQQGEAFLLLRKRQRQNTDTSPTNKIPSEEEILDSIQKLKMLLGRRRLMANNFDNRYTNATEIVGIKTNRTISNNTSVSSHPIISKRYGKWHRVLENKTELSDIFHRQAAEGLLTFGYHPYRRMNYTEQHGDNERDRHNNTKSSEKISVDYFSKESIFEDEEEEFDGTSPGICEVSLACPSSTNRSLN